jgi:hypothetical protein
MATNGNGKREAADELLVVALASGASYSAAAKAAHISKSTVARRMAEPDFRVRVIEEREAHLDSARRRLAAAGPEAISVLVELSRNATSENVRLGAARTVADLALSQRRVAPDIFNAADVARLTRDLLEIVLRHLPEERSYGFARELELYFESGRIPR